MPARLSVNINKVALLRNSRGQDTPSLGWAIDEALGAGAHGITIHPRLDQRHVRFDDIPAVGEHLRRRWPGVELNIECEDDPGLIARVLAERPAQCTLVPVKPGEVTSDHGWDLPAQAARLAPTVRRLQDAGVRVSIFMDCEAEALAHAAALGVDRVELYTGPYAEAWGGPRQEAERARVLACAAAAARLGLGLNAGHDLDRVNLAGLRDIPNLAEVSIGHALTCRALEVGYARSVTELVEALGWMD